MDRITGFSLAEVLIALLVMSGLSIMLLKQQWQNNRLLNQMNQRIALLNQLDNASEHYLSSGTAGKIDNGFSVKSQKNQRTLTLHATCATPIRSGCRLSRELSV